MDDTFAKPSGLALRDELETMVLKELLGPGSAEEEIIESPGTRYFGGVLAPRKRAAPVKAHDSTGQPAEDDEELEGDILDGDELALGALPRETTQDGTTDQAPAQDRALIPSSLGMTFSVEPQVKEIDVSAAWGQYAREKSEYLVSEKTGNPRLAWKRYSRGGKHRLTIHEGPVPPIAVDQNSPEVVVQGLIRKRPDHWRITPFLVNDQQEPATRKDSAWVFQPELLGPGSAEEEIIESPGTRLGERRVNCGK